jgi:uncharacterized protein (TIGR02246 family)
MKDTTDPQIAQQIRERGKKYDEAFNKNDAAAVAALFTEDGLQVAPEGVFSGRQAIEGRYAEHVFQQWHCNNHVLKTDQVIAVGDEVCSTGEWSCTATQDQSGGTIQVHGYFTDVNFRDGDTWKIRISTFNLVPPAETK